MSRRVDFIVERSESRATLAGHDRASEDIKGYNTPQSLLRGWSRGLPRGQYPLFFRRLAEVVAINQVFFTDVIYPPVFQEVNKLAGILMKDASP